jgi:small-conductance mechanosensitive channel
VDLQEKRQLDLVKQAASVRARARPWRAIIFTVLAIAAACVSYAFGRHLKTLFEPGHLGDSIGAASAAVAFLVFATIAVVSVASRARETLQSVTGSAHAGVVRYVIVLFGAILTIAITLALLKVPVGQLLVGGRSPRSSSPSRASRRSATSSPGSSCCCRGRFRSAM